jgi:hypothetical protein
MTPRHETTIEVPCPTCFVRAGEPCVGIESRRRVPRLHAARYLKPAAEGALVSDLCLADTPLGRPATFVKIDAISFADASPAQLQAARSADRVLNRNNYVIREFSTLLSLVERVTETEAANAWFVA